jgi:hypothetical protein
MIDGSMHSEQESEEVKEKQRGSPTIHPVGGINRDCPAHRREAQTATKLTDSGTCFAVSTWRNSG